MLAGAAEIFFCAIAGWRKWYDSNNFGYILACLSRLQVAGSCGTKTLQAAADACIISIVRFVVAVRVSIVKCSFRDI